MDAGSIAGLLYATMTAGATGFQLALALGAPLGAYAMAGKYPGRFPVPMRVAALAQALILALLAVIVLARAGLAFEAGPLAAPWLIWVVVAFSSVSLVLNSLTPSKGERLVWVPVALAMLGSSLVVALIG